MIDLNDTKNANGMAMEIYGSIVYISATGEENVGEKKCTYAFVYCI